MLTREEVKAEHAAYRQRRRRLVDLPLLALAVVVLGFATIGLRLVFAAHEFTPGAAACFAIAVLALPAYPIWAWRRDRTGRSGPMRCPECRRRYSPDVATITGRCSECGVKFVSDSLDDVEPPADASLPTWATFAARHGVYQRRMQAFVIIWATLIIVGLLGVLAMSTAIEDLPTRQAVGFPSMFGLIVLMFACLALGEHLLTPKERNVCPHCQREPQLKDSLVLMHGRCPKCDGRLWRRETPKEQCRMSFKRPRRQFAENQRRSSRSTAWLGSLAFLMPIGLFLGGAALFAPPNPEPTAAFAGLLAFVAVAAGAAYIGYLIERRLPRLFNADCPACHEPLPRVAVATQHCPRCGEHVIADEPDDVARPTQSPAV